jgi:hypothetical protein
MRTLLMASTVYLLSACSTTLVVHDISTILDEDADTKPNSFGELDEAKRGIPFRVLETTTVRLYQRQPDGSYSEVGKPVRGNVPATDKLYALNYKSGQFSNHTFTLTLNADGTIATVGATESKQLDEALAAIKTEAAGIATAAIDRDVTEKSREKTDLELEAGLLDAQRLVIEAEDKLRAAEEARISAENEEDDSEE